MIKFPEMHLFIRIVCKNNKFDLFIIIVAETIMDIPIKRTAKGGKNVV